MGALIGSLLRNHRAGFQAHTLEQGLTLLQFAGNKHLGISHARVGQAFLLHDSETDPGLVAHMHVERDSIMRGSVLPEHCPAGDSARRTRARLNRSRKAVKEYAFGHFWTLYRGGYDTF